jgi:putative colanic acid biosynthesis UDP-glucose lipid carrier transferase
MAVIGFFSFCAKAGTHHALPWSIAETELKGPGHKDMIRSLDGQFMVLHGRLSAARAIESFLDPVIVVSTLLLCSFAFGEQIDRKHFILGVLMFSLTFPGNPFFRAGCKRIIRNNVMDWFPIAGMMLVFGYASGYIHAFNERAMLTWVLVFPVALTTAQIALKQTLPRILQANGKCRRAVIVGCNDIGKKLRDSLAACPHEGLEFVGFFDDRTRSRLEHIDESALLGSFDTLPQFVSSHNVEHIYLALPMASQPRILALLDDLKDTTASIFFVPDLFVTDLIQGRLDDVGGVPVVAVCETPFTGFHGVAKRTMDIVLSALILVLISPLLLAIAIAIKATSRGPVIFRQRRYGLDGKQIIVYKFRSMTVCEDGDTIRQAQKSDQRITPLGAFLRRTSLDELPQFVNVLQGRMSIVGPRPHAIAHNEMYRKLIKGYMVRHKVKPGITGWAQVNGSRGETETVEKMQKRIEYDLEYLRNWSMTLDLWIILKTILVLRGQNNAY